MGRCEHRDCPTSEYEWYPMREGAGLDGGGHLLRKRPYCILCGMTHNISSDSAKRLGFYTNALDRIRERVNRLHRRTGGAIERFTSVQMRLVIKELEGNEEFEDRYVLDRSDQRSIFIETLRKHRPDITPGMLDDYL